MKSKPTQTKPGIIRILFTIGDGEATDAITAELEAAKLNVIGSFNNVDAAVMRAAGCDVEFAALLLRMSTDRALEVAARLQDSGSKAVVLIAQSVNQELIDRALATGVWAYLVQPMTTETVLSSVMITACRFNDFVRARTEVAWLRKQKEERDLIDRAKQLLMAECRLNEQQAYRSLQQMSSKRSEPMAAVAKDILDKAAQKQQTNVS